MNVCSEYEKLNGLNECGVSKLGATFTIPMIDKDYTVNNRAHVVSQVMLWLS